MIDRTPNPPKMFRAVTVTGAAPAIHPEGGALILRTEELGDVSFELYLYGINVVRSALSALEEILLQSGSA